ncbi:MAG: alkene reductase [Acidobacteriaceae bacterium]|nr:alkene reductase [Acidobacteriaceae bacterium]
MKKLLSPLSLGPYTLRNRVVMAPLTRTRADEGNVPSAMALEYYRQRASAGLIITEGTPVSPFGHGYRGTPGIHTEAQRDGWRPITQAVHELGGTIFQQIWHVGRLSHQDLQPGGVLPVAPSAIRSSGEALTWDGPKARPVPRALEAAEIPGVIEEFRRSAQLALEAGFDGVEVHGANGYLPDQFLNSSSNHRTDEWGGSVENRARFLLAVTDAVINVWGADRVGVRLSPTNEHGDISDNNRWETYSYAVAEVNKRRPAYIHLVSPRVSGNLDVQPQLDLGPDRFRPLVTGNTRLLAAGGYKPADAEALLQRGDADAIAFGRLFIANPDLPHRIELDAELNSYDRSTFYTRGTEGYTDYLTLEQAEAARQEHTERENEYVEVEQ